MSLVFALCDRIQVLQQGPHHRHRHSRMRSAPTPTVRQAYLGDEAV